MSDADEARLGAAVERVWPDGAREWEVLGGGITNHNVKVTRPDGVYARLYALQMFGRRPLLTSVTAVTDALGLSPKRFIERFKFEVGMTPKRYCRVLRFQRAIARAHSGGRVDWVQLALERGFSDQAHLIHEFRAFSGLTPTAYLAARTESRNHVKFLQDGDSGA